MYTREIISHLSRTSDLAKLCAESALLSDTRIQAYLARSLVIMASAYVEISVREILFEFCLARSSPVVASYVRSSVRMENSINCAKLQKILDKFDKAIWGRLCGMLTEEQKSAIDSLKDLRDQAAHGGNNNTGYVVVTRYFDAIRDFPRILEGSLIGGM